MKQIETIFFSGATQVDIEIACTHRFSIKYSILRSLCDSPEREAKYFSQFTGLHVMRELEWY